MSKADEIIKDAINEPKKKKEKKGIRLLTGNTIRDIILGGETNVFGVKVGVIWNIIGLYGVGKTFEGTELIAVNRKKYGDKFKWNYDETSEGGNDIDTETIYGFKILNENSLRSATVEELSVNIKKFVKTLKEDEIGCYVVDSLDGLISNEIKQRIIDREKAYEKGKEFNEGSYLMARAKFLKQEFFPDIRPLIEKSNCLLIIISQQSKKVGVMFGSTKDRAGGDALHYFCHIESWTRKIEDFKIVKKGYEFTLGLRNRTDFTRTRNERNGCYHYTSIYSSRGLLYGIDDLSSNLDFLFNLLTDSGKDKTNFNVDFDDNIFKSKKELIAYIEDKNLEEKIKEMVIDKWEEIENSIKIERKRKY